MLTFQNNGHVFN